MAASERRGRPAEREERAGDESGAREIQLHPSKSARGHLFHLLAAIILLLPAALCSSNWPPGEPAGVWAHETDVIRIKVGGLFESSDHQQANVFIRTIKMINERRDETIRRLLNMSDSNQPPAASDNGTQEAGQVSQPGERGFVRQRPIGVKMEPMIEFLEDKHSSLQADQKVCQLIGSGVRVIAGPSEGASIQHVQSICDNMELPYFELRPFISSAGGGALEAQPAGREGARSSASEGKTWNKLEELTLNLYPPAHLLNSAYIDLIYAWNWTSFVIVYQDGSSMIKLQDLFKESSGSWTSRWQIRLFQFDPNAATNRSSGLEQQEPRGDERPIKREQPVAAGDEKRSQRERLSSFRDIFWRIRASGEQNILLDVNSEHLFAALKQAQQVGCMTDRFNYLVTSLDLHTIELEDFKYSRTRITALSILQLARPPSVAFDESYLEKLGIHWAPSKPAAGEQQQPARWAGEQVAGKQVERPHRLSASVVLNKTGAFMEPPPDAYRDYSRREQLISSPASMGLLPSLDRDNEQRLFEFLVGQQRRPASRLRLSTTSALLHDSLLLLALGLQELDPSGSLQVGDGGPVDCSGSGSPWPHGSSLVNYMRRASFVGLTGPVSFDQRGLRADFKLDVLGMAPNLGLIKVGEWRSSGEWPAKKEEEEQEEREWAGRPYDELSRRYLAELRHYQRQLVAGKQVEVPYGRPLAAKSSGAGQPRLRVNEIIFNRLYRDQSDQVDTLIVTTKLSQPYFMLKETPNKLEGNDQYEGFAVDLIHELSKLVNFRYRWREVADKKYGSKEVLANGTVVWNGMIGEIVRGQADLAIVDLTITAQREEAVDFTLPFMNTGISILFKKPTTKVTTLFSFLSPFSSDVWAYVLAAYCGISAILFFVGHLSPYEWADPHPCRHSMSSGRSSRDSADSLDGATEQAAAEEEGADCFVPSNSLRLNRSKQQVRLLKNQFSLLNSFWFTIGSLMQQGSDLTPRSMSTRTIAGIWYFFTLIMISSYTANLAAFLTVEKVVYPIENVRDLSAQQEIKYGCVESGSTCTFFHDSQIDTYKLINENMRKFGTYVRSNDEGQKRVEEGKFAFFMESASIEYIIERNCNLTQIGGLLDSKGYGLATSKKSRLRRPYRTLLSEGILHLQETGMLHILKNRWWKERRGGGTCTDDGKGGGVTELSLANVGGVFVVLLGGLGISFLVAIAEFMWRSRRRGNSRDRICDEMMADLRFALACKRSTKPTGAALERRLREAQRQRRRQEAAKQRALLLQLHQRQLLHKQLLAAGAHQPGDMQALISQLDASMLAPAVLTALLAGGQQLAEPHLSHHLPADQVDSDEARRSARRRILLAQETLDDDVEVDQLDDASGGDHLACAYNQ